MPFRQEQVQPIRQLHKIGACQITDKSNPLNPEREKQAAPENLNLSQNLRKVAHF